MTKRSVVAVILLTIFTLGIYHFVWLAKTKNEFIRCGHTDMPSTGLMILGIFIFPVLIWWEWKWASGLEHVTRGKLSQVIGFILIFLLGVIGQAIIQAEINKAVDQGTPNALPQARVA